MILDHIRPKIKGLVGKIRLVERKDVFLSLVIILVAFLSFGLGRLSKIEEAKIPVRIIGTETPIPAAKNDASAVSAIPAGGNYVASKNGSKYFLPWCSGASQIKEENKIWFSSVEEAKATGYTPAANCKGL